MMASTNEDVMHPSPGAARSEGVHVPSSPERSQLSTPKISHQARAVILDTPPLILNTFSSPKHQLPTAPSLDYDSDHTPTPLDGDQYRFDPLEPPAWKPPERDEVEYVDSWNTAYNNPHHYLNGYSYNNDDSSTICSSQTNNSLSKSYSSRDRPGQQILRPRGFSINSYGSAHKGGSHFRHPSFGSCPQQPPRRGQKHHHRHDSLPVALFSSTSIAQSPHTNQSQQSHPLLAQQEDEHNKRMKNARAYNMIQPRKQNGPYEIHSHQHASQVKADATISGLTGVLIDLYAVDRSVDDATSKMLAMSSPEKKNKEHGHKTSVGTLKDVQTILELHKVDKMVDRFKRELQMPVFFEEEDADLTILKELRGIDLLIGKVHKNKDISVKSTIYENTKQNQYQFDMSEEDDEDGCEDGGSGDDICLSTDSFHADMEESDPYQFYDPHETTAMASNSFEQSYSTASREDLYPVMDLLRTDVEVDGASRRQKELKCVQPFLEVDKSVLKWRRQMERKKCERDMLDLYMTDVEVNRAKGRVKANSDTSRKEQANKNEEMNKPSTKGVKDQHDIHPPLPAVTPERSMRSIFPHREKLNSSLAVASTVSDDAQFNIGLKRSIFTDQEKTQGNSS